VAHGEDDRHRYEHRQRVTTTPDQRHERQGRDENGLDGVLLVGEWPERLQSEQRENPHDAGNGGVECEWMLLDGGA
jgi:hypothetical protein